MQFLLHGCFMIDSTTRSFATGGECSKPLLKTLLNDSASQLNLSDRVSK